MQQRMKDFLSELADLLEKYKVEMEAVDNSESYYPAVGGVEFQMSPDYDFGLDYCEFRIRKYSDANTIREQIPKD